MSEFKLSVPISDNYVLRSETAEDGTTEDWLVIEGEVSDTSWDKKKGRVYPEAIRSMVETANGSRHTPMFGSDRVAKSIGIDVEHSSWWNDQIGEVTEASVIERPDGPAMYVKARVDMNMSAGRDLKRRLDKGKKLGWSIYGTAKGYRDGEGREHFKSIELQKIAITAQPVNQNTWIKAVSRSMEDIEEDMPEENNQEASNEAAPVETEVKLSEDIMAPLTDTTPDVPTDLAQVPASGAEQEVVRAGSRTPAPNEPMKPPSFVELYAAFARQVAPLLDKDDLDALDRTADAILRDTDEANEPEENPDTDDPTSEAAENNKVIRPPSNRKAVRKSMTEDPALPPALEEAESDAETPIARAELIGLDVATSLAASSNEKFEAVATSLGSISRSVEALENTYQDLPERIERSEAKTASIESDIDMIIKHCNDLTKVINNLMQMPAGRRGVVARSFSQEDDEAHIAASGPPSPERIEALRNLKEKGRGDLASQVILGLLSQEEANAQLGSH